jgi:hypothetical protein
MARGGRGLGRQGSAAWVFARTDRDSDQRNRVSALADEGRLGTALKEDALAKEEKKGNKETKKPKADKPKGPGSAYKQSLSKSGQAVAPSMKKG